MKVNQPNPKYGYASFLKRLTASSIDGAILIALGVMLNSSGRSGLSLGGLVALAYSFYFWIKQDGQTLGKRAMGIKIIREDKKPIDIATALIRYLGYLVSFFPLVLGYFWVIFDSKKQAWHDKLAKTYVINTDAKSRTGLIILFNLFSILALIFFIIILIGGGIFALYLLNTNGGLRKNILNDLALPSPTTFFTQ